MSRPIQAEDSQDKHGERLAFKPAEAACVLGISRARVFEFLRDGSLQSVSYGRTRLIPRAAIDRFLQIDPDEE